MRAEVLDTRDEWLADAVATIIGLAYSQPEFSADDLARELRPAPHPNLTGVAFSKARMAGYITTVGIHSSATKSRNGGIQRVWSRATTGVVQ